MIRKKNGQSIIEIAFVLPIFMIMFLGSIEWGMYFFAKLTLESAAFNAARKAVTIRDWVTNQSVRTQEVVTAFTDISGYISSTAVPNIASNIVVEFQNSVSDIQYIKVKTNTLNNNGITGLRSTYMVPATLNAEARVAYEGY